MLDLDFPQWRLAQVFLSSRVKIFEVYVCQYGKYEGWLSCNCPGFETRRYCKHVQYVIDHTDEDGDYCTKLDRHPTDQEMKRFHVEPKFARLWFLEHSIPEVV